MGFILCLKNLLLFHRALLKLGIQILHAPWCNNLCRAFKELGQSNFYSFDQEKVLFLSIYLLLFLSINLYNLFIYLPPPPPFFMKTCLYCQPPFSNFVPPPFPPLPSCHQPPPPHFMCYSMIIWICTCRSLVPQYLKDLDVCFMQQGIKFIEVRYIIRFFIGTLI